MNECVFIQIATELTRTGRFLYCKNFPAALWRKFAVYQLLRSQKNQNALIVKILQNKSNFTKDENKKLQDAQIDDLKNWRRNGVSFIVKQLFAGADLPKEMQTDWDDLNEPLGLTKASF